MQHIADTTFQLYRQAYGDLLSLLAADTPDAAFRSGVRNILGEIPPPPGRYLDWLPARIRPGAAWGDVATQIAASFQAYTTPATTLLGEFAGTTLAFQSTDPVVRFLGDDEHDDPQLLEADKGDQVYERTGMFCAGPATDPVVAACTRLVLLINRVPPQAWRAIWEGQPCGGVLAPYGLRLGRRQAAVTRSGVDVTAVRILGSTPVAIAAEHIPQSFCQHLADLASGMPGRQA